MEQLEQELKDFEHNRLNFYQACLEEFSQLNYNDLYLEQIKADIERLKNKASNLA